MSGTEHDHSIAAPAHGSPPPEDEGGLHAPPELHGWRKAWWWFDFIILVKLARLRFVGILVVIGIIITQWDTLAAYYDKWTRPAESAEAAAAGMEYFCPMHPSIVRDNAKEKCPICFMPLSKRKKGAENSEPLPAGTVSRVQLSPYRIVLAGIETRPAEIVPLTKDITAVGTIEFSERGERTVSARVAGRIDTLLANETGQMVKAGDPLALFYSPDLLVTVQNMLDARHSGNEELLASSRTRLRRLDIDDAQINAILAADRADAHLTIRSPAAGHIIRKYVREGQYVQEGTPLFELADLSTVWVQAQVYEDDLAFLPIDYQHGAKPVDLPGLNVTATTRSAPGRVFQGTLAFIYPHVDQDTRTVTVRFELENPGHVLRPGSTAIVTLHAKIPEQSRALAVPESAVIDTGRERIVYRETSPGVFEGVEVTAGPRMTGPPGPTGNNGATYFPILSGLSPGDQIVTSGTFLVDAETRLNPAAGSIFIGGSGGKRGAAPATSVRPTTPSDEDETIKAALAKLKPEDRSLVLVQGNCPILGGRLGAMGVPFKLKVEGQTIFLCCHNCQDKALANPRKTLERVEELRRAKSGAATPDKPVPVGAPAAVSQILTADEEAEIRANLEKLSPEDRRQAVAQRFCAVKNKNRLGGPMGPPIKIVLGGEPIFLCCTSCEAQAKAHSRETLAAAKRLREVNGGTQP